MTELTDFLEMILALNISFMAKMEEFLLRVTFHTLPKPPFPTTNAFSKCLTVVGGASLVYGNLVEEGG